MEKVAPNSKFVGHSTEVIWQCKIRAPLKQINVVPPGKLWRASSIVPLESQKTGENMAKIFPILKICQ